MWSYLSGFAALVYIVAPIVYLTLGVRPVLTYGTTFFWHVVPYLLLNQLLFLVVGRGSASWRGQQYSLALFPTWIRASVTAAANVWFNRDLGFVVTPKTRQDRRGTWRLVWVQLASAALLVLAIVIGLIRLAAGVAPTTIGTYINIVWALYELAILSVIVSALRYRGSETSSQVEA